MHGTGSRQGQAESTNRKEAQGSGSVEETSGWEAKALGCPRIGWRIESLRQKQGMKEKIAASCRVCVCVCACPCSCMFYFASLPGQPDNFDH